MGMKKMQTYTLDEALVEKMKTIPKGQRSKLVAGLLHKYFEQLPCASTITQTDAQLPPTSPNQEKIISEGI